MDLFLTDPFFWRPHDSGPSLQNDRVGAGVDEVSHSSLQLQTTYPKVRPITLDMFSVGILCGSALLLGLPFLVRKISAIKTPPPDVLYKLSIITTALWILCRTCELILVPVSGNGFYQFCLHIAATIAQYYLLFVVETTRFGAILKWDLVGFTSAFIFTTHRYHLLPYGIVVLWAIASMGRAVEMLVGKVKKEGRISRAQLIDLDRYLLWAEYIASASIAVWQFFNGEYLVALLVPVYLVADVEARTMSITKQWRRGVWTVRTAGAPKPPSKVIRVGKMVG